MDLNLLGRVLLSSMFVVSVYENLTGGFNGSVEFVKSANVPYPQLSVFLAVLLKAYGSHALLTGKNIVEALPLLMLFLILMMYMFNNPTKDPKLKWKFYGLCGTLGGLLIVYDSENKK